MCLGFLNLVVLLHHLNLDGGHGHASASLQLVINAHSLQKGKGGPCKFFRHGSQEEKKRRYECVCDACRQTTTWVEKLAAHKFCPSKGDHGP